MALQEALCAQHCILHAYAYSKFSVSMSFIRIRLKNHIQHASHGSHKMKMSDSAAAALISMFAVMAALTILL